MSVVLKDVEDLLGLNLPINEFGSLLETLCGMSLDSDFCDGIILEHSLILIRIVKNFIIAENDLTKVALEILINVTSHIGSTSKLSSINLDGMDVSFSGFVRKVMKLMLYAKDAHVKSKAAHLLSNMTREHSDMFEHLKVVDSQALVDIYRIGLLLDTSIPEEDKEDAIMVVLNLSKGSSGQKFIMENLHFLNDLLEISKSTPNEKWMFASFGIMKNLLKNADFHDDLLEKTDLLTILLHPLVGLHNYHQNIIDAFPEKLKEFVGKHKTVPTDLRCVILEALYLLSGTKTGRITMRNINTYDILKNISEMDLTDEESDNCLDCIGLLIRYEHEIDCDNLLNLEIPKDVEEKLKK